MAYPFENNPLEDYLRERRALDQLDYMLSNPVSRAGRKHPAVAARRALLDRELRRRRQALRGRQLQPRTFDVWKSPYILALEEHARAHPPPEQPIACQHEKTKFKRHRTKNAGWHIWEQCLVCGEVTSRPKRRDHPQWESYPVFDQGLRRRFEQAVTAYRDWEHAFRERYFKEFDHAGFRRQYEADHPPPLVRSDCDHSHTQLTVRVYEGKGTGAAVVEQCTQCGTHIRSVSRKQVEDMEALPPFNEALENDADAERAAWQRTYAAELEAAQAAHRRSIDEAGAQPVKSSYYDSPEWSRTRERILARDDGVCQSCGEPADEVHHLLYERLGREHDLDLMSLCVLCHMGVHAFQDQFPHRHVITPVEIALLDPQQVILESAEG